MVLSFLLVLIATLSGSLLTYGYDKDALLPARVCAGACLGLALLGFAGFVVASFGGMTTFALVLSAVLTAAPLGLLGSPKWRAALRQDMIRTRRKLLRARQRELICLLFYLGAAVLLWRFFDRALVEQDGGVYTGVANNLGDLPLHVGIVVGFARGDNFPPEHPEFAGARLTYPFLVDFVAALFVRAGASIRNALFLENGVLAMALVGLLHRWAGVLTRHTGAALGAPVLVLLNGGLGWWLLGHDARETGRGILDLIQAPPHDYTILVAQDAGLRWGNPLTTLLITQRGLLFGLPLVLLVWTLWWQTVGGAREKAVHRMIAAGAIAGLLPLIHAHSFLVAVGTGICFALLFKRWRAGSVFVAAALLVAVGPIAWMQAGSTMDAGSFLGWHWGWEKGSANFCWFWFKNTGFFLPLLLVALLWRGRGRPVPLRLCLFSLPFLLCFLVPNVIRLAPWVFDNIKVLIYWYVGFTPLVALLLARCWQRYVRVRVAIVGLALSLILAGGLDVWRVASKGVLLSVWDRDAVAFAQVIAENTRPRARVLGAPTHNHPVLLAGRRLLVGYPGHLWSHGIDYQAREADVRRVYGGGPGAQAIMDHYQIEYVVLGPPERALGIVNESFFERYRKVGQAGGYTLYKNEPRR